MSEQMTPAEAHKAKLPQAVKDAIAKGARAQEMFVQPFVPPEGDEAAPPVVAQAPPSSDADAATEQPLEAPAAEESIAPAPSPAEADVPALQGQLDQAVARAEASDQLARQMQGRYDSYKAKTDARIEELERQLRETSAPPAVSPAGDITDEERAEFGEDLIALIDRVANSRVGSVTRSLREEVEQLHSQVRGNGADGNGADSTMNTVYAYMDAHAPSWRALNTDKDFIAWLAQVDAMSNKSRQEFLNEAFAAKDAVRLAAIFNTYQPAPAAASPAPSPPAPAPAPVEVHSGDVSLESMAAPGTSAGAPAPVTEQAKKVFTRDEVAAFYAQVQKGRYKNYPDERARMEAEFTAAAREGRIVGNSKLATPVMSG